MVFQRGEDDSEQGTGICIMFSEIDSCHLQAFLKFILLQKNEDIRKYHLWTDQSLC